VRWGVQRSGECGVFRTAKRKEFRAATLTRLKA
jgi:hypothetical protein